MCIEHDRACHRRLDDDAPGDAELGAEDVGAGGKDNVADACVGKCTGQVGDGAYRSAYSGLQFTAVSPIKGLSGRALGARAQGDEAKHQ